MIVRRGDVAPGTSRLFDFIGMPAMNAKGEMAFMGYLRGDGGNGLNDQGIWFVDTAGNVSLVALGGDTIDLGGSPQTIWDLSFPDGTFSAPTGMLSDDGKVMFGATFLGAQDAVVIAAVPEPAGLVVCAALSAAVLRRKRVK
jgi:hypothetical protein